MKSAKKVDLSPTERACCRTTRSWTIWFRKPSLELIADGATINGKVTVFADDVKGAILMARQQMAADKAFTWCSPVTRVRCNCEIDVFTMKLEVENETVIYDEGMHWV